MPTNKHFGSRNLTILILSPQKTAFLKQKTFYEKKTNFFEKKEPKNRFFQFADKVCKLEQTERNEVIFHKKRAQAYNGKVVEFFVKTLENTMGILIPYINAIELQSKNEARFLFFYFFQGCKERVCLRSERTEKSVLLSFMPLMHLS